MKISSAVILLIACLLFLAPLTTKASTPTFSDINGNIINFAKSSGYNTQTDYTMIVAQIIQAALSLVGAIFLVLIIYGGFLYMTGESGSDKNRLDKAKKVIRNSLLGLVIIVLAYAITSFTASVMESSSKSGTTPVSGTSTSSQP